MPIENIACLLGKIAENLKVSEALVSRDIIPRIALIERNARFFVLEKEYTEREWKEMVSLHYINTSYKPRASVIRIHFFINGEIKSDSYLGFVTLRPITETRASLSFIYPNWKVLIREQKKVWGKIYVMTYKRHVHIEGKELLIDTFPFFSQDRVVTRCAHADLVMVTKYVKEKLGYRSVKLTDIIEGYSPSARLFPSLGITVQQMVEVFNKIEIPVSIVDFKKSEECDFQEWVDSYIESGLPVILAGRAHVFIIIGHTLNEKGDKKYLVYDDSGEFFKEIKDDTDPGIEKSKSFVETVEWEKIKCYLAGVGAEECMSYMIAPEMERFFVPFPYIKAKSEYFIGEFLSKESCKIKIKHKRFLIIDNSSLKKFLNDECLVDNKISGEKTSFEEFMQECLPHYLWLCEVVVIKDGKEEIYACWADPTLHVESECDMFYRRIVQLNKDKRVSLLTTF